MEAVKVRTGIDEEWWLATELVIVAVAVMFSFTLLSNRDVWFGPRFDRGPSGSGVSSDHPDLRVVGTGEEAQKGVGNTLQGAVSVPQADSKGSGLQPNSGKANVLQPNAETQQQQSGLNR